METISKLSRKCAECPRVSSCNSKRLEMCALSMPRIENNNITININTKELNQDNIIKDIQKEMLKSIGCGFGRY